MGWTLGKRVVTVLSGAAMAGGMSLVATAGPAAGQTTFTPSSGTADGAAGSLRDVLEDDIAAGDIVVLDGGTYTLDKVPNGSGGDIDVKADVTIQGNGATIRQTIFNQRVLDTDDDLTLRNVTITGGRENSDGGGVRLDDSEPTLTIEGSTLTDNATVSDIAPCFILGNDGGAIESDGPLVIRSSTISNNSACDDGGAMSTGGTTTVTASTFVGNCSEGDAGALDGDAVATLVNSTVTGNTSDNDGAINMEEGDFTLVYTDVVDNIHQEDVDCPNTSGADAAAPADATDAPEPDDAEGDVEAQDTDEAANIDVDTDDSFLAFGSVVALPRNGPGETGTPFNCVVGAVATTTSSGFNFSDDDTCEFTNTAQGDRENAGDPGLAALASNGGPTQTRLPQPGSPLINFIPIPDCSGGDDIAGFAVNEDQRGASRPQETGCEIGSVEIEPPPEPVPPAPAQAAQVPTAVPVEPRFTG
jgi:hypothetical protein